MNGLDIEERKVSDTNEIRNASVFQIQNPNSLYLLQHLRRGKKPESLGVKRNKGFF